MGEEQQLPWNLSLILQKYHRTPYPYNVPPDMQEFQERCNRYKCPHKYPGRFCHNPLIYPGEKCHPFGYQPKRTNPGGMKFHEFEYPFQTQFGKPYSNKGAGWYYYNNTGRMPYQQ